jgi:hypothetical protein
MLHIKGRGFDGGAVETDDTKFTDCTFNSVELRYAGGEHPMFEGCTFDGEVSWRFMDAGLRTVQFLQRIGSGENGKAFIADLFQPGKYFTE